MTAVAVGERQGQMERPYRQPDPRHPACANAALWRALLQDPALQHLEALLWLHLYRTGYSTDFAVATPIRELARLVRCDRPTIRRALQGLQAKGFLEIEPVRIPKRGQYPNLYRVTLPEALAQRLNKCSA